MPSQGRHSGASVDRAENVRKLESKKNANDGYHPCLCAATRKADVSTKVGQSPLRCSWLIVSTATTFCPRYCFMVTPTRHRLDCSVFCDRSLQCKHRVANPIFFLITTRFFRVEMKRCCASWIVFGPRRNARASSIFPLSCQKSPTFAKLDTILGIASSENCLTNVKSPETICVSPLVWESPELNLINKCVVSDIQHCAFGSHWRKATRLMFGGQSHRACFHSLYSCRFRCHGEHGFCSFREGHKHLFLQGILTQQSATYPPRLVAFIARLLVDP